MSIVKSFDFFTAFFYFIYASADRQAERVAWSTATYRYIQTVIMMGFFLFFQALCEFVMHCNKRHIFLCLFVLLAHYYW